MLAPLRRSRGPTFRASTSESVHTTMSESAVVSADRARRFPLCLKGSYLVLTDASETDLRAFWQVSSDDLIPAVAGFARGRVRPLPVLRLRRLDGGGAGLVREIALRLTGPGGQGEQLFSVQAQPGRYEAELGLSDGAGGWMMLARSNALDHAARVDVRLGPIQRRAPEPQSVTQDAVAEEDALAEDAIVDDARMEDVGRDHAGGGNVTAPLEADRGETAPAGSSANDGPSMPPGFAEALFGSASETPGIHEPSLSDDTALQGPADGQGGVERMDTQHPRHAAASRPALSPTAPLVYGQASPRPGELMIEAELRVNGCAAPGSEIDLFGYPYRVGPGGRFQLIIRVDDPDVIARAFALNPPMLPDRAKDD